MRPLQENYRGHKIYKELQRHLKPTSNNQRNCQNYNKTINVNNVDNINCENTQQLTFNVDPLLKNSQTYAQTASSNNSAPSFNNQINGNSLLNFLDKFKSLIKLLISFLTTVLGRILT